MQPYTEQGRILQQQTKAQMPASALLAVERRGRLAQGVQDRGRFRLSWISVLAKMQQHQDVLEFCCAGSSLPDSWTCEVVDRKSGGQDVYYRAPEGVRFRSDLEVYRHLGLEVLVVTKGKTPSKRAQEPLSTRLVKPKNCTISAVFVLSRRKAAHRCPATLVCHVLPYCLKFPAAPGCGVSILYLQPSLPLLDIYADQAGQQVLVQATKQAYEALTPISSLDVKDLPDILQEVLLDPPQCHCT